MEPVDFDDLLDRELRRLPAPRAPQSLLPRVLAATSAVRGEATGWTTWPVWGRVASVAAVILAVTGIWWLSPGAPRQVEAVSQAAVDTALVVRVFRDVLLQPLATYIFVLGIALALTCAAAWAALEFALGGASHR